VDVAETTVMSYSRAYPLELEATFDAVLALPLDVLFDKRYAAIPPIRATEGPADWGTVGQSRLIRLTGGGSMRERLTLVDRPRAYGYRLDEVTGPMKPIADHIDGLWSFAPAGTGTRITWQWTTHPRSAVTASALPLLAKMWTGYARQALERIEELLVPA
jgi:hypothetical protein